MSRTQDRRKKTHSMPAYGDPLTPAHQRAQAEFDRQRDQQHRSICNVFRFWSGCPESRCQRQRSCAGDAEACFDRRWWRVSERKKILFRTFVKARVAGMSFAEAVGAAVDDIVRSADHIARVDADTAARIEAEKAARHGK